MLVELGCTAVVPPILQLGVGFTVTTALPLVVPVQFLSLTAVTVYVVVVPGVTVKVYGEVPMLFTVTGVVPSVYVIDHGAVPVSATEIVALCPIHTAVVPLIVAVGSGFTVTTALPLVVPVQFLSLTAVTV
jgi:hypothetical protein